MIPLLIKEKVQNYYFNKWKESIKIMHEQYYDYVRLTVFDNSFLIYYRFLLIHSKNWFGDFGDRKIESFIKYGKNNNINYPSKYQYSSGLNHPTAFK